MLNFLLTPLVLLALCGLTQAQTKSPATVQLSVKDRAGEGQFSQRTAPLQADERLIGERNTISASAHTVGVVSVKVADTGGSISSVNVGGGSSLSYFVQVKGDPGDSFLRYTFEAASKTELQVKWSASGPLDSAEFTQSASIGIAHGNESRWVSDVEMTTTVSNKIYNAGLSTANYSSGRVFYTSSYGETAVKDNTTTLLEGIKQITGAGSNFAARDSVGAEAAFSSTSTDYSGALDIKLDNKGYGLILVSLGCTHYIGVGRNDGGGSLGDTSGSCYFDPYFAVEPAYLASHPNATLTVLDGIGNSPISSVPESGKLAYILFGLLAVFANRRLPT